MTLSLDEIDFVGAGLNRPECVVAHASGLLIVPDWTPPGGVALIAPDGSVRRVLATAPGPGVETPVRPNGIALEDGGTVLLAHLGDARGGVYRLHADGRCERVVDAVDGAPMPPANFVAADAAGRLWITASTTLTPRARDYRPDAASGFVALWDGAACRRVADGLGYANECLLSADARTLWVNETFARRLTAFDVTGDGLADRRTIASFGPGVFPDGLAEAADGSLFVTSIVSNAVLRVWPDGRVETVLRDADADHVAWVETAFQAGAMGRAHLDRAAGRRLRNVSNLAFGGPDLRTAHLGCLLGDAVARFSAPVAGRALPHWTHDLGPLRETP